MLPVYPHSPPLPDDFRDCGALVLGLVERLAHLLHVLEDTYMGYEEQAHYTYPAKGESAR